MIKFSLSMQFGSLITAMITPFKESNEYEIDYQAVEKLVEHLIKTGSDSIIVAGTTGESPTLTHEEEYELLKFVKEKAHAINPDIKIIFGAGSNSTQTVIDSCKQAEKYDIDGLLIVAPYYNKPNQKGLLAHFHTIAQNTKLPIILYNIPGRCVINMNVETISELVEKNPNIVALKEASNNIDQVSALRAKFEKERFQIYSGDDSLTLAMMAAGGDGVISVSSHLAGEEMKNMIELFSSGELTQAQAIHKKLFPLFEALFWQPNPTCVKAALRAQQLCSSKLRLPLVELEDSELKALIKVLASVLGNESSLHCKA